MSRKIPLLAFILSLALPGLGQCYAGSPFLGCGAVALTPIAFLVFLKLWGDALGGIACVLTWLFIGADARRRAIHRNVIHSHYYDPRP